MNVKKTIRRGLFSFRKVSNESFRFLIPVFFFLILIGCGSQNMQNKESITYLALGDSYTIGEQVTEEQTWPIRLTTELNSRGHTLEKPKIIAVTGWTTQDLLSAMAKKLDNNEKFDLVSVLIGVNNQYQKKDISIYKEDLLKILQKAIEHCSQREKGVFVLSIPDYSVTPFGKEKTEDWDISGEIRNYNKVCKEISQNLGLAFYDITPISLKAENNPNMLTADKLHPSGEMYRLWTEKILSEVEAKLP